MPARTQKILKNIAANGRIASAYMFLGPPQSGKKAAAESFSETLKCSKQDKFVLSPDGASIKIHQIKDLQSMVRYGPAISPYFVVIIEKADSLTDQAVAALLKTLEEPPGGVVFVLLVEREDKIPATIHSRCQKVIFSETVVSWQKKEDWEAFYKALGQIQNKRKNECLLLAKELASHKDEIEEMLYDLAYFSRYSLLKEKFARIILDTVRFIKRRANLKVALDVMCLRLGGNYAG